MPQTDRENLLHMTLAPDELNALVVTSRDPTDYVAIDLPVMGVGASVDLAIDQNGNEYMRLLLPFPPGLLKPKGAVLFGSDNKPIKRELTVAGLAPSVHLVLRQDALNPAALDDLNESLHQGMAQTPLES